MCFQDKGSDSVRIDFALSEKGSMLQAKNLLLLGSKAFSKGANPFLLRVDPFSEGI